jgi:hypothetical protein
MIQGYRIHTDISRTPPNYHTVRLLLRLIPTASVIDIAIVKGVRIRIRIHHVFSVSPSSSMHHHHQRERTWRLQLLRRSSLTLNFVEVKGLPNSHRRWETKRVGFDSHGITIKGQAVRDTWPIRQSDPKHTWEKAKMEREFKTSPQRVLYPSETVRNVLLLKEVRG